MDEKCKYPGCELAAATGKQVCVFHAPKDEKGIALELFNDRIRDLQGKRHRNFEGFVFPGPINFRKRFEEDVTFKKAVFHGHADFEGGEFDRNANFENAQFERGANFRSAKFKRTVSFDLASFTGAAQPGDARKMCFDGYGSEFRQEATFRAARFSGGFVVCDNASFSGRLAIFERSEFRECWVYFVNATFSCQLVDFTLTRFISSPASFTRCRFEQGGLSFASAEFDLGSVHFNSASFVGEGVTFEGCKFTNANVSYTHANFDCTNIRFDEVSFKNCKVDFSDCRFSGGDVSFTKTEFGNGDIDFSRATFSHDLRLRNNVMPKELKFIDTRFDERSAFYLTDPIFKVSSYRPSRVWFSRVRFNPFLTFFGGIRMGDDHARSIVSENPIVLFRYCHLKDAYFANNDMSLLSFYNSSFFEEAHFISCQWIEREEQILKVFPLRFRRVRQIIEEQLLDAANTHYSNRASGGDLRQYYRIQSLRSHSDVADMYRRMKAAADRGKDYHLASGFYFNEFEMKRRDRAIRASQAEKLSTKAGAAAQLVLYSVYKLFAGYGEKTWWSFAWFLVFSGLFAVLHLFNGFRVPGQGSATRVINYDWQRALPNVWQLLGDFFHSVLFTLYRIIPVSYLPYQRLKFDLVDYGFWDLALTLANSVVLIVIIIFIGMGLKRHFRRF